MAILYDARLRALDTDGNPLVGATLTIYTANTATPAAVYRDAALTVPMTNPSSAPQDVSDAGGGFPQIFAAEGTLVDIIMKDSGGSTIKTYVDVPFIGAADAEFTRTMPDDTRLKITGSGGRVLMQVGDASPDNVGGSLTVQGWAGTQADEILLDGAVVNTTGVLTEKTKKLQGVVTVEGTFTAAANVVIPLTATSEGERAWRIDLFDLISSTAGVIQISLELSFDGAATYAPAGSYSDLYWFESVSVPGFDDQHNSAVNAIFIATDIRSITNIPMWSTIEILTASAAGSSDATWVKGLTIGRGNPNTQPSMTKFNGSCQFASMGQATHAKIGVSSGTIAGKYRVTPLRGFGE